MRSGSIEPCNWLVIWARNWTLQGVQHTHTGKANTLQGHMQEVCDTSTQTIKLRLHSMQESTAALRGLDFISAFTGPG